MNIFGDERVDWAKYRWARAAGRKPASIRTLPATAWNPKRVLGFPNQCAQASLCPHALPHAPLEPPHTHQRYFDPESVGLDFVGMTADLEAAPDGSIVLLHGQFARPVKQCTCTYIWVVEMCVFVCV